MSSHETLQFQEHFLQLASTSMMGNPDLEQPDNKTRSAILKAAREVARFDPEFVLKVRRKRKDTFEARESEH